MLANHSNFHLHILSLMSLWFCCVLPLALVPVSSCKFSWPNDTLLSAKINATLNFLADTELQVVTYRKDTRLLLYLWKSLELFVPILKGD